jgi:hypothetical protein
MIIEVFKITLKKLLTIRKLENLGLVGCDVVSLCEMFSAVGNHSHNLAASRPKAPESSITPVELP